MNPKNLRALSYIGLVLVMIFSGYYAFRTWQNGEPRWNFVILTFGIAILLGYNLIGRRR